MERALLGGERKYTRHEVAQLAGADVDMARRLWVALGFATVGDDDVVFTDGDVDALRVWTALHELGAIPDDQATSAARAVGQALGGLASWQVTEIVGRFAELGAGPADAAAIAEALIPALQRLQNYAWRRHLAASAGRAFIAGDTERSTTTSAVGFADIVGYTRTTRHLDTTELAQLLEEFEADAAATVVEHDGRIVKTVGDEVLFVVERPADAAEIALRLTDDERARGGLPTLRVGLAYGTVLTRFGDVYGSVVNLAARLTGLARPGSALVDKEIARELDGDPRYRLRTRRPTSVRGYAHLRSWALQRG
ncbi:MAG: adenylate/guanylate cyclase domain-containing protein [Sciscionella sp.]|nr:adenylate/guanylate cyclase domain-containing protein [Sciscionella sp.]